MCKLKSGVKERNEGKIRQISLKYFVPERSCEREQ